MSGASAWQKLHDVMLHITHRQLSFTAALGLQLHASSVCAAEQHRLDTRGNNLDADLVSLLITERQLPYGAVPLASRS